MVFYFWFKVNLGHLEVMKEHYKKHKLKNISLNIFLAYKIGWWNIIHGVVSLQLDKQCELEIRKYLVPFFSFGLYDGTFGVILYGFAL